MNVRDAVAAFLDGTRGEIAASTSTRYATALKPFVEREGDRPLASVKPGHIRAFRSDRLDRGVSPHTVNSDLRALRRLFGWLVREGLIAENVPRAVPFVKTAREVPKAISADDLGRLLAWLPEEPPRNRALILFLIDTGCRIGGAVGLTLERLSLEQRRAIVIEKGEKSRPVFFTSVTAEALAEWLRRRGKDPSPLVFLSAKGGGLTVGGAHQLIERVGERAGLVGRCNPHSFRHAFAREYLRAGGHMAGLQQLMGHEPGSPVTARFYAVWDGDEMADLHARHSPLLRLLGANGKGR